MLAVQAKREAEMNEGYNETLRKFGATDAEINEIYIHAQTLEQRIALLEKLDSDEEEIKSARKEWKQTLLRLSNKNHERCLVIRVWADQRLAPLPKAL